MDVPNFYASNRAQHLSLILREIVCSPILIKFPSSFERPPSYPYSDITHNRC
jgi:hypothetical protein